MKQLPSKYQVRRELESNRNHSWYDEIYKRHKHELSRVVIKYLGTDITYRKFFRESMKWAKALKANGIKKGDEFVVCMDRTPEVAYLLGAASITGAKINLISEKFDKEFIKSIIKTSDSKLFFVQDVKVSKMKELLKELPEKKIVPVSYKRSINEKFPFLGFIKDYYSLDEEEYNKTITELNNIYVLEDFLESGRNYKGKVKEESTLDDVFTTTYSSGTTKKGYPKGITHVNRHYILMGRYHDPEVSGIPSMKELSTYSNIPVYSNSYLSSSLSDNLIQGGVVILDPVDDSKYFVYGMKMHKSNMNIATTSTWLLIVNDYFNKNRKYTLEHALFNFAAGEQLSPGEEKTLNKFLKETKAGTKVTHTPVSISKMSTAGSDCEHGSLFIRIFRSYYNMSPYHFKRPEPIGMKVYDFANVKVLREDGSHAYPYEYGRIVCNSGCTMKEYDRNPEATKEFFIKDIFGKTWGDMNVYGYLDEKGNVTMKGRIPKEKDTIPNFMIADEIGKDTKKIMSCEVVDVDYNGQTLYIAHIITQPKTSINYEAITYSIMSRCINRFGEDIKDKIYIKFRKNYPLTSSAKRDIKALKQEGLSSAYHPIYLSKKNKTRKRTTYKVIK